MAIFGGNLRSVWRRYSAVIRGEYGGDIRRESLGHTAKTFDGVGRTFYIVLWKTPAERRGDLLSDKITDIFFFLGVKYKVENGRDKSVDSKRYD